MLAFETERLSIRPTGIEDAAFVLALLNTPKWHKYIGDRKVHTQDQAIAYIENRMLSQLERLGYGNYTVIRKGDVTKIGTVGLFDREGLEGVDVGFAFLPEFEGKGYAFEASNKLMTIAKNDFGLETINAITVKENLSSQKLLEKLGLRFEKLINLPSDPEELLFYSWSKKG